VKYFTRQLWLDLQRSDGPSEASSRQWSENAAAYLRDLSSLRDRVTPDVFDFFHKADVHDGSLMHFRVAETDPLAEAPPPEGDGVDLQPDGDAWEGPYPLGVEFAVAERSGVAWTLRYQGIRRILLDFPTESPLFFYPGMGFDDWGYDELSDAGDGFLRHEVLFSSGAVVLVEFRGVTVSRTEPSADQR